MPETEKGKALLKWQPNDKFKDEYDRIFKKKGEIEAQDPETEDGANVSTYKKKPGLAG